MRFVGEFTAWSSFSTHSQPLLLLSSGSQLIMYMRCTYIHSHSHTEEEEEEAPRLSPGLALNSCCGVSVLQLHLPCHKCHSRVKLWRKSLVAISVSAGSAVWQAIVTAELHTKHMDTELVPVDAGKLITSLSLRLPWTQHDIVQTQATLYIQDMWHNEMSVHLDPGCKNILNKSKSNIHKKHCSVGTERGRCVRTCRHLGTAHGCSVFNWNCIMLKHSSDLPVTRWFTALLLRWSFIFIQCRWNCLEKTKTKDWVNKIRELVNLLWLC